MKLIKKIFVFVGIAIILIFFAIRFNVWDLLNQKNEKQNKIPENNLVKTTVKEAKENFEAKKEQLLKEEKAQIKTNEKIEDKSKDNSKEEKVVIKPNLGMGNPFAYSSSNGDDYSPLSNSKNVGLISIRGIIFIEGSKPRAILHLKDQNKSYYVTKGDVIRVNTQAKGGSLVTEAYISIKDIRPEEVELVQQERPDKVIIIR